MKVADWVSVAAMRGMGMARDCTRVKNACIFNLESFIDQRIFIVRGKARKKERLRKAQWKTILNQGDAVVDRVIETT